MANVTEELLDGLALVEIELVLIRTADRDYLIKTGSEASLKPRVSSGEEKELRKKDTIYAQYRTNDLVKGFDLELTDVLMNPKVFALVDGGVSTFATGGKFEEYASPEVGKAVVRQQLGVDIYCANKDEGGNTIDYMVFTLEGCVGKPVEITLKDGEFFAPKYTLQSTPPRGSKPIKIKAAAIAELPTDTTESGG